ncbi:MAG: helix-hairpin-helix domain-containing protein [Cytophagales bacterium]|nr:helix-hairpin-helix domain-containing protein [Cytophagales bacterium]MCA6391841.1 helix-hairpin-helix domain-containing protein [Cytophagales bacterium]MCA6396164.1 helix-hairpin-helix domain-containing protein [Cytophagales bacterium]MCA6404484.1 helix-hairpin-helix domain-containing protein [Cytophagales bacterium]MCA6410784.1 helix-hairpin-helix domain-containing protein [Cytophagales bacterium]
MNRLKAWIRSFFGFSRSETNALLILLPLMVLLIFSEPAYRYWFTNQELSFSKDSLRLDSLVAKWQWEKADSNPESVDRPLFRFNPNTASRDSLLQLGFSPSLARRIVNYRTKGGVFKIKSDLLKMYGADTLLFQKLYSFIDLPLIAEKKRKEFFKDSFPMRPIVATTKLDLNLADTAQLIKVYGIGPKFSLRIVEYRERLGGFVSMDQLNEVYRLDTTAVGRLKKKFFVLPDYHPRQIRLNTATEKELAAHPYISYKLAAAVVAYRFQHGYFASIEDLVNLKLVTEKDFQRIKPYITINP